MAAVDDILAKATEAGERFRRLGQNQTDYIVRAAYHAGFNARVRLAKMAHEETNLGVWQHKVIKNVIATQLVYEDIRHERTAGVISEDRRTGIIELAEPLGPILALVPFNNPTSTTLFKILIALKTRNPLIISPHNAAKNCTVEAAKVCYEAAVEAGAPEDCIQWVPKASPEKIQDLMSHRRLRLILATGTGSLVRAAFSSGTPTLGIGSGNVPVYIGESADIPFAVHHILESKTFDHGSICASEQAVVVKQTMADDIIAEFQRRGAYFLAPPEIEKVGAVAFDPERRVMKATVVGQSAPRIAGMAGFEVPPETQVLIARLEGVGPDYPLSAEVLAPVLAFYAEEDFEQAIARCCEIINYGGQGHTAGIYSNDTIKIEYFCDKVSAARLLVNMPCTHGALGGMYNTLHPSFTLGCGSAAHNTTTDNITARHLLNIHRISRLRSNERWIKFDQAKYLDESLTAEAIEKEYNWNF
jgi:acetaldehyde dehydrogenase/alcohol dehydrogenase